MKNFLSSLIVLLISNLCSAQSISDYSTLVNEGIRYLDVSNVREAKIKYEQALKIKPDGVEALYGFAVCLCAQCAENEASCTDALNYLLRVEKQAGNYRSTYQNITACYLRMAQFERAIQYCDKSIALNAQDAESFYYRAYARLQLGKSSEGCEDGRTSLKLGHEPAKKLIEDLCK